MPNPDQPQQHPVSATELFGWTVSSVCAATGHRMDCREIMFFAGPGAMTAVLILWAVIYGDRTAVHA